LRKRDSRFACWTGFQEIRKSIVRGSLFGLLVLRDVSGDPIDDMLLLAAG